LEFWEITVRNIIEQSFALKTVQCAVEGTVVTAHAIQGEKRYRSTRS